MQVGLGFKNTHVKLQGAPPNILVWQKQATQPTWSILAFMFLHVNFIPSYQDIYIYLSKNTPNAGVTQ